MISKKVIYLLFSTIVIALLLSTISEVGAKEQIGVCEGAFFDCLMDAYSNKSDPAIGLAYASFCLNGFLFCKTYYPV